MSVGHKPCCPPKKELDAKKATIIRMRKYAREVGEDREVTRAKIESIRNHDLSTGVIVRCETEKKFYIFSIKK